MENENKISSMAGSAHCTEEIMSACALCPRECLADRSAGKKGFCGMDERIYLARAALHMWEEPCISGTKGSGAVFFSGCGLRCCFCQNHDIAIGSRGRAVSVERLGEIFLELKEKGAANINLVTGAHYVPQIIEALDMARRNGLDIPVVYNSSGYEKTETLKLLEGYVDIYLPDLKYLDPELAQKFSNAPDYVQAAKAAIGEDGYIRTGTIVRHLILPGHTGNSIKALRYLHETYGEDIYISIMNQYTPVRKFVEFKELNRKVTKREYEKVLDAAVDMGIQNGFIRKEKLLQKALFRISIMREWKKILHKWKEAGTFVPARMKKKNIIESSSPSMVYNIQ